MDDVNQEQAAPGNGSSHDKKPNDYERVILAAKLARRINDHRVVAREQLPPEEIAKIDQRKVTSVALDDLETGKVKIIRQKEKREEETFDLT
jgi:DNA-directed RNA polymerase subunit K/omega